MKIEKENWKALAGNRSLVRTKTTSPSLNELAPGQQGPTRVDTVNESQANQFDIQGARVASNWINPSTSQVCTDGGGQGGNHRFLP